MNVVDLSDIWTLYFHDPFDTNWTYPSYIRICDIASIEYYNDLMSHISDNINMGMFFVFREGIFPCWDDPSNINGGSLSFKVLKCNVKGFWNNICIKVLSDDILKNSEKYDFDTVTGISVSPKKDYCIIKVWFNSLDIIDVSFLNMSSDNIYEGECLFKTNREKITN